MKDSYLFWRVSILHNEIFFHTSMWDSCWAKWYWNFVSPGASSFHHCSKLIYHRPEVCDIADQAAHYHILGLHLWSDTWLVTKLASLFYVNISYLFWKWSQFVSKKLHQLPSLYCPYWDFIWMFVSETCQKIWYNAFILWEVVSHRTIFWEKWEICIEIKILVFEQGLSTLCSIGRVQHHK
jgi:hypothetical protein